MLYNFWWWKSHVTVGVLHSARMTVSFPTPNQNTTENSASILHGKGTKSSCLSWCWIWMKCQVFGCWPQPQHMYELHQWSVTGWGSPRPLSGLSVRKKSVREQFITWPSFVNLTWRCLWHVHQLAVAWQKSIFIFTRARLVWKYILYVHEVPTNNQLFLYNCCQRSDLRP